MRHPARLAMLAASLLIAGSGCSSQKDPTAKEFKAELADDLATTKDLTQKAATCYANVIVDELGIKRLNRVKIGDDSPPSADKAAYVAAVQKAATTCA